MLLTSEYKGSVAEELGINKRTVFLWTQKYRNRSADETLDDILSVSDGKGLKDEPSGETGYPRLITFSESSVFIEFVFMPKHAT